MARLAAEDRFEEAGLLRDRVRSLVQALARSRFERWLAAPEALVVEGADGTRYRFRRGRFGGGLEGEAAGVALPVPPADADEVAAVRSWLGANPVRVVEASGEPVAEPVEGGRRLHDLARRIDQAVGADRSG